MKTVINMPDGCYEELNNGQFPIQDAYRLVAWIKEGTPLPKNHGRLIDADAFERRCMFDSDIEDMQDLIYALRGFKPIIEADTEKEDKEVEHETDN